VRGVTGRCLRSHDLYRSSSACKEGKVLLEGGQKEQVSDDVSDCCAVSANTV
jgi:hypothetical protein